MNSGILNMSFDVAAFWDARNVLLLGAGVTISLTVLTMILAIPLGLVLAQLRTSRFPLVQKIATGWVELFRSTPLLLQLFWIYYILPSSFGLALPAFLVALLGFTLNVSAFNSETFRAGVASIPRNQASAGLALGMTDAQVLRRIVLPQAMRRVIPPLASTWVSLFQNTSIVSFIGLADMTFNATGLRTHTFQDLEVLTALAVAYLILGYPQAKIADALYHRLRVRV